MRTACCRGSEISRAAHRPLGIRECLRPGVSELGERRGPSFVDGRIDDLHRLDRLLVRFAVREDAERDLDPVQLPL